MHYHKIASIAYTSKNQVIRKSKINTLYNNSDPRYISSKAY